MFCFLSSSQDDFKWSLDAMVMQLSLKRLQGTCEPKNCVL